MALDALGGRCIFASEVCPTAMSIYRANFPRTQHCSNEDVTRVEFSTSTVSKEETIPVPPHLDLLVGGFPCQSFSSLGDMAGLDDARGLLYREVVPFSPMTTTITTMTTMTTTTTFRHRPHPNGWPHASWTRVVRWSNTDSSSNRSVRWWKPTC